MSDFLSDDRVEEFDIQKTVLKSRNTKKEPKVYVEYDRLTSLPVAVSSAELQATSKRNAVAVIAESEMTARLLQNRLSLSKLIIKRNHATGQLELIQHQQTRKGEFDFIFATLSEKSFIHLQCCVITKKIQVVFDYNIFKLNMFLEKTSEKNLEELPDYLEIYCIDKNEHSKLYGKLTVPTKDLFEQHNISFNCPWLPDSAAGLKNIGFLYYNDNQIISYDYQFTKELVVENSLDYRPNLLYKQEGNVLKLQSTIQNIDSFRLKDQVELYICQKYDPTKMLGSVKFSSKELNNYNNFEIKLSSDKQVKLVCNYFHLHTKEEDASTDYRF